MQGPCAVLVQRGASSCSASRLPHGKNCHGHVICHARPITPTPVTCDGRPFIAAAAGQRRKGAVIIQAPTSLSARLLSAPTFLFEHFLEYFVEDCARKSAFEA